MASMLRFVRRHYRDVVALVYLLVIYPQMINESHLSPESPTWPWFIAFWVLMSLLGVVGNTLKMASLDPVIVEKGLQREVKATATRFLAGFVALPVLVVVPAFMWAGEEALESWAGPVFLAVALVVCVPMFSCGRGKSARALPRWQARLSTVLLLLFELHLYTIFLESLWLTEKSFHVSLWTLFFLIFPMTGLFFLLFMPATIGFYLEQCVRSGSWASAAAGQWVRFLGYRYLPSYVVFYLEGRGLRLPWII